MLKPYSRQRVHIIKPVGTVGNSCDMPNALKKDYNTSHFQEMDIIFFSNAGFALAFRLISSSGKWVRPNINAFQWKDFT